MELEFVAIDMLMIYLSNEDILVLTLKASMLTDLQTDYYQGQGFWVGDFNVNGTF